MVNITISNQYGDCEPATLSMNNISEDMTIASIKILVDTQFKCMKPNFKNDEDSKDKYVLFCGNRMLDDDSYIRDYNQMNLPELKFSLYMKNYINIDVKVMKYIQCCGIHMTPIIYKLWPRKLSFKLLDQEPLLKLKNGILQELHLYKHKGTSLSLDVIRLLHKGYILEDDHQLLKEVNSGKNMQMVLLIPLRFRRTNKEDDMKKDSEEQPAQMEENEDTENKMARN